MLRQLLTIALLLVGSLTFNQAFSQQTNGIHSIGTADELEDFGQAQMRNIPYISIQYCTS